VVACDWLWKREYSLEYSKEYSAEYSFLNLKKKIKFLMFWEKYSFGHIFLIRRPFFEPFAAPKSGGRALSIRLGSN